MGPELSEPVRDVLKGLFLGDIVDQKGSAGAPIVRRCDGSVPVLTRRVPNLRLDHVACFRGDRASGELDADRRPRLQVELVLAKSGQQVRLAYARVAHEYDFVDQVVALLLLSAWSTCIGG